MAQKWCVRCEAYHENSEFYLDSRTSSGYRSECKKWTVYPYRSKHPEANSRKDINTDARRVVDALVGVNGECAWKVPEIVAATGLEKERVLVILETLVHVKLVTKNGDLFEPAEVLYSNKNAARFKSGLVSVVHTNDIGIGHASFG